MVQSEGGKQLREMPCCLSPCAMSHELSNMHLKLTILLIFRGE